MEIKILFNSEGINQEILIGWGISVLIDGRILFDTGGKADFLIRNIRKMNIDLSYIESVVISHDHWDHTGGLLEILKQRKGICVYVCPHFSIEFKNKVRGLGGNLTEVEGFSEISENIFVTGEIPGTYEGMYMPEQAVVIKTEKGLTVITGCAHPGILKILEKVKERFPEERFYLAFGGFHLKDSDKRVINKIVDRFKEMNIEEVGPTHCTGKEAEKVFKKIYREKCILIKAGQKIMV